MYVVVLLWADAGCVNILPHFRRKGQFTVFHMSDDFVCFFLVRNVNFRRLPSTSRVFAVLLSLLRYTSCVAMPIAQMASRTSNVCCSFRCFPWLAILCVCVYVHVRWGFEATSTPDRNLTAFPVRIWYRYTTLIVIMQSVSRIAAEDDSSDVPPETEDFLRVFGESEIGI